MPSNPSFSDEFFGTRLSVPGKTFLLGEYGALLGEAALLCATSPEFQIRPLKVPQLLGIHPESPAGLYWKNSGASFGVEFVDPYEGAGGFGASGAQFLGVYALTEFQKSSERLGADGWSELLAAYGRVAGSGPMRPSGADLVAQLVGGLCFFDRNQREVHSLSWPFADLDFVLFKTKSKVATHDHIRQLGVHQLEGLGQLSRAGFEALKAKDESGFLRAVQSMNRALTERGFAVISTQEHLKALSATGLALASKGCGALGADVLAVFCRPDSREALTLQGTELGLTPTGGREVISSGLGWEWTGVLD